MAEPAIRYMGLAEFLRWEDGTDTRYELIDGMPVAMAPPAEAHRILAMRLGSRIDAVLESRRPCNAQIDAGVLRAYLGRAVFRHVMMARAKWSMAR